MIHFEDIYLGPAGRVQQSEKKGVREKSTEEKKEEGEKKRKRGTTRIGSNQGNEITKNPGVQRSGINRARQSAVLC